MVPDPDLPNVIYFANKKLLFNQMTTKTKRGLVGLVGLLLGGLVVLLALQMPNLLGCTYFSDSPSCDGGILFFFSGILYGLTWIIGPFAVIPFLVVGWVIGWIAGRIIFPRDDGLPSVTINKKYSLLSLLLIVLIIAGIIFYFYQYTKQTREIYDPYATQQ